MNFEFGRLIVYDGVPATVVSVDKDCYVIAPVKNTLKLCKDCAQGGAMLISVNDAKIEDFYPMGFLINVEK